MVDLVSGLRLKVSYWDRGNLSVPSQQKWDPLLNCLTTVSELLKSLAYRGCSFSYRVGRKTKVCQGSSTFQLLEEDEMRGHGIRHQTQKPNYWMQNVL